MFKREEFDLVLSEKREALKGIIKDLKEKILHYSQASDYNAQLVDKSKDIDESSRMLLRGDKDTLNNLRKDIYSLFQEYEYKREEEEEEKRKGKKRGKKEDNNLFNDVMDEMSKYCEDASKNIKTHIIMENISKFVSWTEGQKGDNYEAFRKDLGDNIKRYLYFRGTFREANEELIRRQNTADTAMDDMDTAKYLTRFYKIHLGILKALLKSGAKGESETACLALGLLRETIMHILPVISPKTEDPERFSLFDNADEMMYVKLLRLEQNTTKGGFYESDPISLETPDALDSYPFKIVAGPKGKFIIWKFDRIVIYDILTGWSKELRFVGKKYCFIRFNNIICLGDNILLYHKAYFFMKFDEFMKLDSIDLYGPLWVDLVINGISPYKDSSTKAYIILDNTCYLYDFETKKKEPVVEGLTIDDNFNLIDRGRGNLDFCLVNYIRNIKEVIFRFFSGGKEVDLRKFVLPKNNRDWPWNIGKYFRLIMENSDKRDILGEVVLWASSFLIRTDGRWVDTKQKKNGDKMEGVFITKDIFFWYDQRNRQLSLSRITLDLDKFRWIKK